ncbi:MAG: glycosyltransferase family 4 protein [bacterium]|nr:glycosyltransferase family 4 protein [bacterium]
MSTPHVLVDGLVLFNTMGGALLYARETLPRCARLLHERGGRLSLLIAGAERSKNWAQELADAEHLHLQFVDAPMRPALRRAWSEPRAVQAAIEENAALGRAVQVLQTQSLPIPRLPFDGVQIHLCHGLRRLHTGRPLARQFTRSLLRRGARNLHSMVTVSNALSSELNELLPGLALHCISPGADHRIALPRDPSKPQHVICLGPTDPHKNHALLASSWATDPSLPPLRIHAQPGEDITATIKKHGQQDRITWHAPLMETAFAGALATCSALLLPSRLESFGMVALEALHAGAPLAISDLPSHREIVGGARDQVAFFDPTSPTDAAQAVAQALLLDTPESRIQRQHRAAEFTWHGTAQRTVDHWCAASPTTTS